VKRTLLYQVSKDGHVTPIFARSEAPRTRRVWRSWVRDLVACVLYLAVVCLPSALYELAVWISGGVN